MNKTTITKQLKMSRIAGENVIFIKTDDFPRALSIANKTFDNETGVVYSLSRGFHDDDIDYSFDSFEQMIGRLCDIQHEILVLSNAQSKITDNVADQLLNYVMSEGNVFLVFIVPLDYSLPRELDTVATLTLPPPCEKEIEDELYFIFENKRYFNKLNLSEIINSLVGLPLYKIQRFFKYELAENEDLIKLRGSGYISSQLEEERFSHINSIEGLSLLKTEGVELAGNEVVKQKIEEIKSSIEINKKGYKLSKPKGVLLHGVPGVGKTQFAKYIANELNNPLLKIDFGGVYNKWLGVSEERLATIVSFIDSIGNCTVLIDEIHLLFDTEAKAEDTTNRLLNSLLTYMSENDKNVFFVFTANEIDKLPPAMVRKGRLDHIIEIPLPDFETRKAIVKVYLERNDFDLNDLDNFAGESEGKSGADIEWYVEKAIVRSVKEEKELTEEMLLGVVDDSA